MTAPSRTFFEVLRESITDPEILAAADKAERDSRRARRAASAGPQADTDGARH
jgi:hypothetical protein